MIKGDNILNVGTSAGGGVSIIANDPVASGGGGGGDAPPITTDLLVYYNPDVEAYSDAGTTLAADGDNVRQFNDQSGNANTLSQSAASLQPFYDIGTLGAGLGSIKITSTDHLDTTNALTFEQPDANFTFYLVYKKGALGISHYVVGQMAPLVGNSRIWLRNAYYQAYDTNNQNAFVSTTDSTDIIILAITINTSGSATEQRYKVYKNGSFLASTTRDFGGAFRFNNLYGVGWSSISGDFYGGNMLFYNGVHDATQVQEVSDWLNAKYNIY